MVLSLHIQYASSYNYGNIKYFTFIWKIKTILFPAFESVQRGCLQQSLI